jgi:hypothetical protein
VRVVPPLSTPVALPYAVYLRVYEPLTAFSDPERGRWAAAVRRAAEVGAEAARRERLAAEQRSALVGVLSLPPRPVPAEEDGEAFVLEVDGVPHVCPVQSRLRSWVALGQLRETFPEQVLHAFVPPASLDRADAEHATWAALGGPSEVAGPLRTLTATWAVPLPWFLPFAPADRVGADQPGSRAVGTTVVHRTRMSAARRRVARALRTLTRQVGDLEDVDPDVLPPAEEVESLGRWLEEFHARSWLELDYAGLPAVLAAVHPDGAAEDTSVADVAAAVAALAAGDEQGAVRSYREVAERWAAVAALEHAS